MVCKVEIELKVALEKGNFNILLCCGIGSKFVLPDKYVSIHNSNIGHELTSGPLHLSLECPSVSVDHVLDSLEIKSSLASRVRSVS